MNCMKIKCLEEIARYGKAYNSTATSEIIRR